MVLVLQDWVQFYLWPRICIYLAAFLDLGVKIYNFSSCLNIPRTISRRYVALFQNHQLNILPHSASQPGAQTNVQDELLNITYIAYILTWGANNFLYKETKKDVIVNQTFQRSNISLRYRVAMKSMKQHIIETQVRVPTL